LRLLREGGVKGASAESESGWHPTPTPEAWWAAVMGSGYRGTIEQLMDSAREQVRDMNLTFIRDAGVEAVEANVVYAFDAAHARCRFLGRCEDASEETFASGEYKIARLRAILHTLVRGVQWVAEAMLPVTQRVE
jgi:hypothetical protein